MVQQLLQTGDKWKVALDGERFAAFSIVGTNDWQDYASAAMQAMLLETASDVDERLDTLEQGISDVTLLLAEIRDLLARLAPPNGPD